MLTEATSRLVWRNNASYQMVCRAAEKSLAFLFSTFLFAAQPKEFFLDGLKKLEQQSHKCVWSSGRMCKLNTFFQSRSLFSL
jgi:hypothetical protein